MRRENYITVAAVVGAAMMICAAGAAQVSASEDTYEKSSEDVSEGMDKITAEAVRLDPSWEYAGLSKINSGEAVLYQVDGTQAKGITICVNAGHGTAGGSEVKVQCHPDGTPKVTGGTTASGATEAVAVSTGMQFRDGTPEASANLSEAMLVKEKLLAAGYNVLMIRESDDVQLDNLARTLIANHYADCHIAIHYDSTDFDKGVFYCGIPGDAGYRNMEPVRSHWEESEAFGQAVVKAFADGGRTLFSDGRLEMDLTQTSYSEIPSIDLEIGDAASDHSAHTQEVIADCIAEGIERYFDD